MTLGDRVAAVALDCLCFGCFLELDEVESERRRTDCMETMSDLESQFAELKEQ